MRFASLLLWGSPALDGLAARVVVLLLLALAAYGLWLGHAVPLAAVAWNAGPQLAEACREAPGCKAAFLRGADADESPQQRMLVVQLAHDAPAATRDRMAALQRALIRDTTVAGTVLVAEPRPAASRPGPARR